MPDTNSTPYPTPDALVAFLDDLRDAGYNIGIAHYRAAHDVMLALAAQGTLADDPARFKRMLGPIVCSTPAEQDDFQQRYDRWEQQWNPGAVPHSAEAGKPEPAAATFEQQLDELETDLAKRIHRWALIVVVLWMISVTLLVDQSGIFTQPPTSTHTPTPTLTHTVAAGELTPTPAEPPQDTTPGQGVTPEATPEPAVQVRYIPLKDTPQYWWWVAVIGAGTGLLILLGKVANMLWWRKRLNVFLERRATTDTPDVTRVPLRIDTDNADIFPAMLLLHTARNLRRRVSVPSDRLDVQRTIEASIAHAGWFTPVYVPRKEMPEYLVLVDRTSFRDHQAHIVDHMLAQLHKNEVPYKVYSFDGDPRMCVPAKRTEFPRTLRELSKHYADYRLLVFSDANGLFSPITGDLEAWSDQFAPWNERTVVTPVPVEQWGYQEHVLLQQFVVLPTTEQGLLLLTDERVRRDPLLAKQLYADSAAAASVPMPPELRMRPSYWTSHNPPDEAEVDAMMKSLKNYLDDAAYLWLCACAIYPVLEWPLTLYLGHTLLGDGGPLQSHPAPSLSFRMERSGMRNLGQLRASRVSRSRPQRRDTRQNTGSSCQHDRTESTAAEKIITPQRLLALARLPWLRQGYMPDWLRERLINDLSLEQEQHIRGLLEELLVAAVQGKGTVETSSLDIARKHATTVSTLAKQLLQRLSRTAPDDSPVHDYIFLRFMQQRHPHPLLMRLPQAVRDVLFKRRVQARPPRTAWWGAVPVVLVLLLVALAGVLVGNGVQVPVQMQVTNPLFPVTIAEWQNEDTRSSTTLTRDGDHYWRYVPGGTYAIGGWTDDELNNNDEQADVTLQPYWIARFPITVQQYREFIQAGGYDTRAYWTDNGWAWKEEYSVTGRTQPYYWDDERFNSDNQPVTGMTWYETAAFAAWLNSELADTLPAGTCIRLPTEAEWEVACAYDGAGQRHTYPWGEQEPSRDLADFGDGSNLSSPALVGERPAGAAASGAQDMVGSVWEWTTSDYDTFPATSGDVVDDFDTSTYIPIRGGSWWNDRTHVRCSARDRPHHLLDSNHNGLRLLRSPCITR